MPVWLQLFACAGLILFSGTKLSKYGDLIADKTGLGKTWIGIVLMASVTSIPELITGISSVTLFDVPNIAAGDVLGSCMFNIFILAILDLMSGPTPVTTRTHRGQALAAAMGIVLLGFVGLNIVMGARIPAIGWFSVSSLVILVLYLVSLRVVFLYERQRYVEIGDAPTATRKEGEGLSGVQVYTRFGVNAFIVVGAAIFLPHIGEQIAAMTGLGQTFVGSLLIALTTSLPEVVVSAAALRIGAVDMAVGNLVGSNLFNVGILACDDLFYTPGPLLAAISPHHLITAGAAMMMSAIVVVGLTYRTGRKRFVLAWDALGIVIVYILGAAMLSVMK